MIRVYIGKNDQATEREYDAYMNSESTMCYYERQG